MHRPYLILASRCDHAIDSSCLKGVGIGGNTPDSIPRRGCYKAGSFRNNGNRKLLAALTDEAEIFCCQQHEQANILPCLLNRRDAISLSINIEKIPYLSFTGGEIKLDLSIIRNAAAFCNKIWQASRFFLMAQQRKPQFKPINAVWWDDNKGPLRYVLSI